jgi:hypothetical protein
VIRRAASIAQPHRPPYASVELPVPRDPAGPWTFRMPMWSDLASVERTITESDGDIARLSEAFGRVIGMAWADEDHALESDTSHGAAVFAELYEAGWSQSLLFGLAQSILARSHQEIVTDREVRERADFFGANGASVASMSSGSPSATLGASSPSMT